MKPSLAAVNADRGSIAVVTVLAMLLVLAVMGPALVAVTDLSVTAARARAAADAAALAGAATSPLVARGAPEHPDAAARAVTRANTAVFVRSDLRNWPLRYGVTVEVAPQTSWVRRIVGALREEAVGAVRPRVPDSPR